VSPPGGICTRRAEPLELLSRRERNTVRRAQSAQGVMKPKYAMLIAAALVTQQNLCADGRFETVTPELGFSLVLSPGYNNALEDSYPNSSVSGGYGWLGIHAGLRCSVTENVDLIPRIGLMMNYVTSIGAGDSFANTIVQPALAGRVTFNEGDSFYVEGEINHNTVNTGSDAFDVDGGMGYAIFLGYQWESGFDVSVGYSMIPTDVDNVSGTQEENFGGLEFRFRGTF